MAGENVVCPHCGLETKLFVPQLQEKPTPSAPPELPKPQSIQESTETSNTVALSYVFSFSLPIVGFFFGVYLMAKKKAGHGATCMALSIVMSVVWLGIFSNKGGTPTQVGILGKFANLNPDETLKPAQGAYGWNLGDKLPYNFEVTTNDGEITYYSSYDNTDGFDGWLKLTEDRRIASITQCYYDKTDQFDELIKILKEKYGLRRISENYATFGTTNRAVTLFGESGTSFLEYKDVALCQIAEMEKENLKKAAESEKKKQIENDLKTHL